MTIPGGTLELKFRHTGDLSDIEFPHPDAVMGTFEKAGNEWNDWAERDVTRENQEFILENAIKMLVVSKRTVKEFQHLLDPSSAAMDGMRYWNYYNNFTDVLTHKLPRVQHSRKIVRMDHLNSIFRASAQGRLLEAPKTEEVN
jgi:hypothetical protein